jgi:phosphoserine aminotransferase
MNVCFTLDDPGLEQAFLKRAVQAGLCGLQGHRTVGGLRASLYNAMPMEGVEALITFMQSFCEEFQ